MTVTVNVDTKLVANVQYGIVPAALGTDPIFIYQLAALGNTQSSQLTLSATSTPPVTQAWEGVVTCTAGAATLDLTALVTTGLANINATGLKLVAMKIQAVSTNVNPITVKTGVSNGYADIGTGIPLKTAGNESLTVYRGASAVDATHKTIDFVATGTEAVNIILVFGT
jgi:hypothetical protein